MVPQFPIELRERPDGFSAQPVGGYLWSVEGDILRMNLFVPCMQSVNCRQGTITHMVSLEFTVGHHDLIRKEPRLSIRGSIPDPCGFHGYIWDGKLWDTEPPGYGG